MKFLIFSNFEQKTLYKIFIQKVSGLVVILFIDGI